MPNIPNFIKWLVYGIHGLSGIGTLVLYVFLLRENYFINVGQIIVPIYLGSALLAALFHKTQTKLVKAYFLILSALTLSYSGIWLLLALLMMH